MMNKGSNDARRIVWALGEWFVYLFFILFIITHVLLCI